MRIWNSRSYYAFLAQVHYLTLLHLFSWLKLHHTLLPKLHGILRPYFGLSLWFVLPISPEGNEAFSNALFLLFLLLVAAFQDSIFRLSHDRRKSMKFHRIVRGTAGRANFILNSIIIN